MEAQQGGYKNNIEQLPKGKNLPGTFFRCWTSRVRWNGFPCQAYKTWKKDDSEGMPYRSLDVWQANSKLFYKSYNYCKMGSLILCTACGSLKKVLVSWLFFQCTRLLKENLKKSDFLNYAKDAPEYNELLDTLFVLWQIICPLDHNLNVLLWEVKLYLKRLDQTHSIIMLPESHILAIMFSDSLYNILSILICVFHYDHYAISIYISKLIVNYACTHRFYLMSLLTSILQPPLPRNDFKSQNWVTTATNGAGF